MLKTNYNQIKKAIDQIPGWLSDVEKKFLYDTAQKLRTGGVIVEIGSWKGRSTICLALGSKAGPKIKVYAIDPHTGSPDLVNPGEKIWTYEEFIKNIQDAGVADLVVPVVSTAEEAIKKWNLPIAMIFIDANYHSYELTKNLLLEWTPYLVEGGIIALTSTNPSIWGILDGKPLYGLPGPKKVAADFIYGSKIFKNIHLAGCITYAQKCNNNTFNERLAGRLTQLKSEFLYIIYRLYLLLIKIPSPVKKFLKKIILLNK